MEILISELEFAITNKLYALALNIALVIPDICAAVTSSNNRTDGNKYKEWCNKYVIGKFNGKIDSNDIYQLRCASLHEAKLKNRSSRFRKIVFRACLKIIFVEFHIRFRIIWQLAHRIHASALLAVFS